MAQFFPFGAHIRSLSGTSARRDARVEATIAARLSQCCYLSEVAVSFKKVLIADSDPVAARAAETGVNLAQALGAEVAFVNVVHSAAD